MSQPITKYFKSHRIEKKTTAKKRIISLSLKKTPSPAKVKRDDPAEINANTVNLCSSDDDVSPSKNLITQNENTVESAISNLSDTTEIYFQSPHSSNGSLLLTPTKTHISPTGTPKLISPSSTIRTKYFSPSKKRLVSKRNISTVSRNLNAEFVTRKEKPHKSLLDKNFLEICKGYDDKTKFLLGIINEYLNDTSMLPLLKDDAQTLLRNTLQLYKPGATVVCRLYWRRTGWYRQGAILKIVNKLHTDNNVDATAMLASLVQYGFLVKGDENNMKTIEDYTHLLSLQHIHDICKTLKIKKTSKDKCIEQLNKYAHSTADIGSYFSKGPVRNNSFNLLKLLRQHTGPCYRLSDLAHNTLYRLYVLTYLGIDYEYIRSNSLERMLMLEYLKIETFPAEQVKVFDKPSVVFRSPEEFEHYVVARETYETFIASTNAENKCAMVENIFTMFKNITSEQMQSYNELPVWFRRFTPGYLYVKIMETGLVDLKKLKRPQMYQLAVEILTCLIQQNVFRVHKRAHWYDEKALIFHKCLCMHSVAASVLLEGLESNMPEKMRDVLLARARLLARQKNIQLENTLKVKLLMFAEKPSILEGSLPSHTIHKQAMENTTKGKVMYETRSEGGRKIQGVEDYALSCYLESVEYTHGGHWEGRIIVNIFYLLFWDIIYAELPHVRGVFLSRYQKFPLDLYTESFYPNRRAAIDRRLDEIENCDIAQFHDTMYNKWRDRPNSHTEVSGMSREVEATQVAAVCAALGARGVATVCRRLATDFRHAHSGFPDLTLYHRTRGTIKFVEVKSENDTPSLKQIQWMRYLTEHGIQTEFCYVGTKTTTKSRQPTKRTSSINYVRQLLGVFNDF